VSFVSERAPRASGKRRSLSEISPDVIDWISSRFGEFQILKEYKGGMSPGCAASVMTASGRELFVKAVDADPDDVTADLFRHEIHVLEKLPQSKHRPRILESYDDGKWVALVLEHINGHYPDFSLHNEFEAVAEVIISQCHELAPPPDGLQVPSLQESVNWWINRWEQISIHPDMFLPDWAECFAPVGLEASKRIAEALPNETLCHFDVRNDNLLMTEDETIVVFDWGIAMTGPTWADKVMLALQIDDLEKANDYLKKWLTKDELEVVDYFLIAFGGSQAWDSKQPVQKRLPNLRSYLKDDAERLLRLALYRTRPKIPL
jgi:aminoglycoside phosphotransferase (APT) family kinase protein